MVRRIVIIGASTAGVEGASAARKKDPTAEITLISQEKIAGYSRCGLPFVIGGQISCFTDLVVYPPVFFNMLKLILCLETRATAIDTQQKTVTVQTKQGITAIPYDSLIIATGADAYTPPIKGKEKQGILSLRSLEDIEKIDASVKAGAKSAIIMGAGLIGLELGVALIERGLKVTIVETLSQILPKFLDADMANLVQQHLEEKGIKILLNRSIDELLGEKKITSINAGREIIEADLFISAFGVRAQTKLATEAGIPIGETGGIKTNERMETQVKDVYAAGDCAEVQNIITHKATCPQLATAAIREGKVAGANAAGGASSFSGVLGSAVTRLFDIEAGNTGFTEMAAQKQSIEVITGVISSKTRANYFPGAKPIKLKIVVEKDSQRIIGAQVVGGEEVTQRINCISLAIQKGMTVGELSRTDTAYAPPLCETWEPMVLAAELILMKLH